MYQKLKLISAFRIFVGIFRLLKYQVVVDWNVDRDNRALIAVYFFFLRQAKQSFIFS